RGNTSAATAGFCWISIDSTRGAVAGHPASGAVLSPIRRQVVPDSPVLVRLLERPADCPHALPPRHPGGFPHRQFAPAPRSANDSRLGAAAPLPARVRRIFATRDDPVHSTTRALEGRPCDIRWPTHPAPVQEA